MSRRRSAQWIMFLCLLPAMGSAEGDPKAAATRFGFEFEEGVPMKIDADELEARRDEKTGRERVEFTGNVRVEQGDLRIQCNWLEAIYPKGGGGKPSRITARGAVRIKQLNNEAQCTEAILNNDRCTARCISDDGPAVLKRGEEVVKGEQILMDMCKGVLKVKGAKVQFGAEKAKP